MTSRTTPVGSLLNLPALLVPSTGEESLPHLSQTEPGDIRGLNPASKSS